MTNMVVTRFARGGYEQKGDWKSASGHRKFQDRWSKSYNVRPSEDIVTPDKIRNVDTTTLSSNYRVLSADANQVTVGPNKTVRNPITNTPITKIAEREERIGNHIVGFTREINTALAQETQYYLDRIAEGREPPYLPKSRLGRSRPKV